MRSLLWKEWHEQRWKLAFTSVLLAGLVFSGLHARVVTDEEVLLFVCGLAVILMPLLIGAVLIAPERDARTLDTLLALPANPSRILAVKTLIGVVLCVAPMAISCILSLAMAAGRELPASSIITLFVRCLLTTLAMFFWVLVLTIRLPGETRATLLGLGILIVWMIITLGLSQARHSASITLLWLINPYVFLIQYGSVRIGFEPVSTVQAAIIQAAIAGALWFWAARQLSTEEARS
jgi:ABC-type transport system involved in multi-copper enzyme maturation permease subunit